MEYSQFYEEFGTPFTGRKKEKGAGISKIYAAAV